jgi:arylsulfatase
MVAIMEFIRLDAHIPVPVRGRYTYYPSAAETERDSAAPRWGRFFQLLAEIEISGDARGVICSQQSSCGGYSLFLRDGKLVFAHDAPDAARGERLDCDTPPFGKHIVGVEFTRNGTARDALGAVTLTVDGRPMAVAPVGTLPTRLAPCGDGLWIGYDGRDGDRAEYGSSFPLAGARVIEIVFDVCEDATVGTERDRTVAPVRD